MADHEELTGLHRSEVVRYRSQHAVRLPLTAALVLTLLTLAGAGAVAGAFDVAAVAVVVILAMGWVLTHSVVEIDLVADVLVLRTALGSATIVPVRTVESIRTTTWSGTRLRTVDGRSRAINVSGSFAPLLAELHRTRPGVGTGAMEPALRMHRQEARRAELRRRFGWIHGFTVASTTIGLVGLTASLALGWDSTAGPTLALGSGTVLTVAALLAPVAFAVAPELQRAAPGGTPDP